MLLVEDPCRQVDAVDVGQIGKAPCSLYDIDDPVAAKGKSVDPGVQHLAGDVDHGTRGRGGGGENDLQGAIVTASGRQDGRGDGDSNQAGWEEERPHQEHLSIPHRERS